MNLSKQFLKLQTYILLTWISFPLSSCGSIFLWKSLLSLRGKGGLKRVLGRENNSSADKLLSYGRTVFCDFEDCPSNSSAGRFIEELTCFCMAINLELLWKEDILHIHRRCNSCYPATCMDYSHGGWDGLRMAFQARKIKGGIVKWQNLQKLSWNTWEMQANVNMLKSN